MTLSQYEMFTLISVQAVICFSRIKNNIQVASCLRHLLWKPELAAFIFLYFSDALEPRNLLPWYTLDNWGFVSTQSQYSLLYCLCMHSRCNKVEWKWQKLCDPQTWHYLLSDRLEKNMNFQFYSSVFSVHWGHPKWVLPNLIWQEQSDTKDK